MLNKVNDTFILLLFMLLSNYCKAQTENKSLNIPVSVKGSTFFNADKKNCIALPFGYSNISKQLPVDSIVSAIQDHRGLENLYALKFEQLLKNDLVMLPEAYDVSFPFEQGIGKEYSHIKIASNFLSYRGYSLHFLAVYNAARYSEPFVEKIYLISVKNGKPVDIKRIYLHHEGEMGFTDYTLFYIDKNSIISLRDYEFNENPFRQKPVYQFQLLRNGTFVRYYDQNGLYKTDEEEGSIKNHHKEGNWIEFKANRYVDLQEYPSFTDSYTYLEARYKGGLPDGKWNCYKLLQEYNEETGEPIISTRKMGPLIYTELYKNGLLEKREFHVLDK
ncbi:hypothetical protein HS960_07880 [Sphingobacterium paramultivorum]|uniref:MORN repeat variant n=1 Tax=Sphingobacterium paramultivorum TaxID=2886510 RepID=A0A7G5E0Q1_9SPHI|nr:hypothetical protein [Sphingobacterium paramultivorum]QMV67576.1 hypothetical protein HS960_07880 [Sphingobacterium paramultivorum]WSO16453.1 hypothetical protein VUL84_07855 [Sphingobacterium paramultivorum]